MTEVKKLFSKERKATRQNLTRSSKEKNDWSEGERDDCEEGKEGREEGKKKECRTPGGGNRANQNSVIHCIARAKLA